MKLSSYQKWQIVIFVISYLCIVARHAGLEGWFMVKSDVNDDLGFSTTWLGAMDSTYLFCYATGNYISGILGDSFPIRFVVPIGMAFGSFCYVVIAILGFSNYDNPWFFIAMFGAIGLTLSTVWPGTVSLMGRWYSRKHTGKILGLWSSNSQVGNILGAQIASIILSVINASWEIVTITTTIFLISIAVIFFILAKEKPNPEWLIQESEPFYEIKDQGPASQEKKSISFFQAWMLPRVAIYAFTYACVKLLNMSLVMWLPFFLDKQIHVDKSLIGTLANLYDIGGLVGGFAFGWVTDKLGFRAPALCLMLIGGLPIFGIIQLMNSDTWWTFFFITFLLGTLIASSDNLISGAVATDLGRNDSNLGNNENVIATVTGIIDGTGALGAASGQIFIGYLAGVGWTYVFIFMLCVNCCAVMLLAKFAIKDTKTFREERKKAKYSVSTKQGE